MYLLTCITEISHHEDDCIVIEFQCMGTSHGGHWDHHIPELPQNQCLTYFIQVTLHPVRIALIVGASDILQMNINKAWRLLEHMCEKESKRSENVNEVSKALIIYSKSSIFITHARDVFKILCLISFRKLMCNY